jgi:enhancing lycopene biosynthesis protein 2
MKKIAVVFSGCGSKDGTEITEAVSVLITLSKKGADYKVFAPNLEIETFDHVSGLSSGKRNLLSESARISRGQITDITHLNVDQFDGIVFPGGYGAAKNLSNWASKGSACEVLPIVKKIITEFHAQEKPICAICIAPTLIAKVLGQHGVELTIGNDPETAKEIEKTGAQHIECKVNDYVTDRLNKIITTPAYMYDAKPHEVYKGIKGAIKEFVEMA